MRVIFMGTPDFAVPTLDALVHAGHDVVLVVAQPSRPAGRGKQMRAPPVAVRATELGLPLAQPKAMRSGPFPERFCDLKAEVAVVIAYGRILPQRLLDAPTLGCINVHASLLPRWRGAAPIQHAILAGDAETGVCTQQMEASLDTGPVFVRQVTGLAADETGGSLHDRLSLMSAACAIETLEGLAKRVPAPQVDVGDTYAHKIGRQDGLVDWSVDAAQLDRRVRAMSPWPGGWVPWNKGPLKLKQVRPAAGTGTPGQILSTNPLIVACGTGALELVAVQAPGKRPVKGSEFCHGARLVAGGTLKWPS
jgi:methionyl-tRNA formyltransferase